MTLDKAIKHAEEVAEEQVKLCKRYDDASGYSRSHNESIRTTDAKRCEECAEEHRQIAEWLKELKSYREDLENDEEFKEIFELIEDILDTLIEVGNGVTDEDLHESADKLFKVRDILNTTVNKQEQIKGRCRDCRYFEYDHWENVSGTPLIVAHEICMKWSDGCKTSKDGYCFLFEEEAEAGEGSDEE